MAKFEYITVVDVNSVLDDLYNSMVQSIFDMVLYNTVSKNKMLVSKSIVSTIAETFERLNNHNVIIRGFRRSDNSLIRTERFRTKPLSFTNWITELNRLLDLIKEGNIYYEDTLANGFCWHTEESYYKLEAMDD